MKTNLEKLLNGKMMRRSMLAAALPAAGMSLAWAGQKVDSPEVDGRMRLGGAWIANDGAGFVFTHTQIPLDSAGKTAALHISLLSYAEAGAGLIAQLGGDTISDFAGKIQMTARDQAEATILGYVQKSGNPRVITAIWLIKGSFVFTDPDTLTGEYTNSIYPPSLDGLPHGDPLLSFPGAPLTLNRVPMM